MADAGWYHAQGDPAGTTRWWNGTEWVGDPAVTSTRSGDSASGTNSTVPAAPLPPERSGMHGANQLASPAQRIGARFIDLLLGLFLAIVLLLSTIGQIVENVQDLPTDATDAQIEAAIQDPLEADGVASRLLFVPVIGFFVEAAFVAFAGGTPGKLMVGIRVAEADSLATPPSPRHAALRSAHRLIPVIGIVIASFSSIASGIGALIGLASLIMLFVNDDHRTVMDTVAGTVVRRR